MISCAHTHRKRQAVLKEEAMPPLRHIRYFLPPNVPSFSCFIVQSPDNQPFSNSLPRVPPGGWDRVNADHQFIIVATVFTTGCSLGSSCVTLWLVRSVRFSRLYLDGMLYSQALCPVLVNCLLSSSKFKISHLLSIPYVTALIKPSPLCIWITTATAPYFSMPPVSPPSHPSFIVFSECLL